MHRGSHVILNGEILPRDEARISVDDLGFLLGDGVFETLRVYQGVPFLVDEHLARLFASLRKVQLQIPWNRDQLRAQIRLLVERNALLHVDGRLRLTVTRGPGTPPARSRGAPTVLITAEPYFPLDMQVYEQGVDVRSSLHRRAPHPGYQVKSTSYQANLQLRRESGVNGAFEVLQWNTDGVLVEGSFTNVFVVDSLGVLRTPHPREGCLKGVTRGAVLSLAARRGIRTHQGQVEPETLATAREIFLTGSMVEIVPVRRLDERRVGSACPGPMTRSIQRSYGSLVAAVVGGQR